MTDNIRPESVNANTFIVRPVGGNTLAGTYSVQLGIVNFHPTQPLQPGTSYEVFLPANGVKDYAGNAIGADFKSTFNTGNAAEVGLSYHWALNGKLSDPISNNDGTPASGDAFESIGLNFANRAGGVQLKNDGVATVLGGTASLSFYMKTTQNGSANAWTAPGIFGRDQSGGADDVFWGWLDNTGRLNLSVANAATNNPGTRSTSPVNDGNWHHVVLTRDAGSGAQTMYIDGAKTSSIGLTGVKGLANKFQWLGQIQGNADFFKGTLADVRVFSRVLGDAEVATLRGQAVIGDPGIGSGPKVVNGALNFNPATLGSGGAQFRWNFGNGTVTAFSSQAGYSYTYTTPGHYTVTLTVKDSAGRETYYTYNVTIIAPVTASAAAHRQHRGRREPGLRGQSRQRHGGGDRRPEPGQAVGGVGGQRGQDAGARPRRPGLGRGAGRGQAGGAQRRRRQRLGHRALRLRQRSLRRGLHARRHQGAC